MSGTDGARILKFSVQINYSEYASLHCDGISPRDPFRYS